MATSKERAVITADWGKGKPVDYDVLYNPKEFSLEKNVRHGEITIPGLDAPLYQYIRGEAEKLSVELFFDTTEKGMGKGAVSVTEHTDKIYRLAKFESSSHAPPIVTFSWGKKFPGCDINEFSSGNGAEGEASSAESSGGSDASEVSFNQVRNSFVGVVESVRQQFTLFSSEGVPLRATVNLVLKEYRPLHEQSPELHAESTDRTHSHPLTDAETLSAIAAIHYDNPGRWRFIARENVIEDPRRLETGRILTVPSIQ